MDNNDRESINFSSAFAPPHRLTVCQPEHGHKTIVDVEPSKLRLLWSYETLADINSNIWKSPEVKWTVEITPSVEGRKFNGSTWERAENGIPCIINRYEDNGILLILEIIGTEKEALIKIDIINQSEKVKICQIACEHKGGWVISNPAWIDGINPNSLQAMEFERPDRLLVIGCGADEYPLSEILQEDSEVPSFQEKNDDKVNFQKTMMLQWEVKPFETRRGWIIRPYDSYAADISELMNQDWDSIFCEAKTNWTDILNKMVSFHIPDSDLKKGFQACFMDLFVMRERLKTGEMVTTPGTKMYRSPNSFEPLIASVMLDQAGFHDKAAEGLKVHIEAQGANGDWADPYGWNHHMWGASGYKAWAVMEHYRLTGDLSFLKKAFPHMLKCSRFQESKRKSTRNHENKRPANEYGLMPRGMGDGGLMNENDYFGVFYPHNFLAVYADKLAFEAASILGLTEERNELESYYMKALSDLNKSLLTGAIIEEDYRWIPGAPGKTSGSNWGALFSVFPCDILKNDHPLITGTLKHIEKHMSTGGLPIGIGWMKDGLWVAISLDNVAESYLRLGNGNEASKYLYPVFNHGTPLFTWCEERHEAPDTPIISGDLQHLWTPVAVCRYIRDALVMERDGGLDLAMGIPREWLSSGKKVGTVKAPTHFGLITYQMIFSESANEISFKMDLKVKGTLPFLNVHVRLPGEFKVSSMHCDRKMRITEDSNIIRMEEPDGKCELIIKMKKMENPI